MNFIISSLNEDFIQRLKQLFIETETKYQIVKRPSKIPEDIEPSVSFIDVDSIQNIEEIKSLSQNENIINVYLLTKDVFGSGVDFPKMNVIDSFITALDLMRITNENSMKYMEAMFLRSPNKIIPKEDAIKTIPKEEIPELPIEEAEEDDFDIPSPKTKTEITVIQAVNEDEDDFDDFDEREDLRKFEFQRQQKKDKPAPPKTPIKNHLIEEPLIIDIDDEEEEQKKTEKKLISAQQIIENPRNINEVLYKNNLRDDKNLRDADYIESLSLDEVIKCPLINGRPMEYIEFTHKPPIDQTLALYRINKLKKKGLEKLEIIDTLAEINREENEIRTRQLKEREKKRQEYMKRLESTKVEIPKHEQVLSADKKLSEKKAFIGEFGDNIPDLGPKVLDSEVCGTQGFIPREAEIIDKKEVDEAPLITRESEAVQLGKKLRMEARKADDDEEALLIAFQKQRAINAENAKKDFQEIQQGKQSINDLSMKLPQRKMIERNPMAKVYATENIQRAESQKEIKRVRPPEEVLTIDDEEDDNNKKKGKGGGLFGFFKKKK